MEKRSGKEALLPESPFSTKRFALNQGERFPGVHQKPRPVLAEALRSEMPRRRMVEQSSSGAPRGALHFPKTFPGEALRFVLPWETKRFGRRQRLGIIPHRPKKGEALRAGGMLATEDGPGPGSRGKRFDLGGLYSGGSASDWPVRKPLLPFGRSEGSASNPRPRTSQPAAGERFPLRKAESTKRFGGGISRTGRGAISERSASGLKLSS